MNSQQIAKNTESITQSNGELYLENLQLQIQIRDLQIELEQLKFENVIARNLFKEISRDLHWSKKMDGENFLLENIDWWIHGGSVGMNYIDSEYK